MNLRTCILAATLTLATFAASPARAHDPDEEFDQLPPAAAAPRTPTTCEELAKQDARGVDDDGATKALRLRCAREKKATAPVAPAKKT